MSIAAAGAFCRRLGVGLRAGANLLRLLEAETKYGSPRQKAALRALLEEIQSGFAINEAMQRQKDFFPRLMIAMTKVGESTGKLERTFLTLAAHYENQVKLRRQFLSSIAWPMIQLTLALFIVSIVIYLMGILTPAGGGQMTDMLGFGLRGGSGVMIFWLYVLCVAAMIGAAIYGFRKNLGGVQNLIPVFYMIPKFGEAIQTITLARFTRILSIGLGAGLDPIRSIKLALASTDSEYYRSGSKTVEVAIQEQGETMSGALRATDLFPPQFLHLVEVSEMSGTESESIEHIADEYEARAAMAMRVISGIATGVVWFCVAAGLVFLILRIAMTYVNGINSALEGLR
ncbi:type II secretion system F family protein [Rhodopirellula sp. MGV]|uniref:type II secretion system F family protein n=1 Tax=Rhodopirellula sp. MGV TaxID=2023130 RepID=UPI001E4CF37B|nr:type II secretion system F family protein [Rhodopirellula sp. MGV]